MRMVGTGRHEEDYSRELLTIPLSTQRKTALTPERHEGGRIAPSENLSNDTPADSSAAFPDREPRSLFNRDRLVQADLHSHNVPRVRPDDGKLVGNVRS